MRTTTNNTILKRARKMGTSSWMVAAVLASITGGCVSQYDSTGGGAVANEAVTSSSGTSGDESNTFDHENGRQQDPFAAPQSSPADTQAFARLHDCAKIKYPVLGNVLTDFGVNLANPAPGSAGDLYRSGASALGAASYPARQPHRSNHTTAETQRLFDVFFSASSEIIANLPGSERCKRNGAPSPLFDAGGKCQVEGLSCLLGIPAKPQHVDLCNTLVAQGSTPAIGQRIAVASLGASHVYCE